MTSGWRRPACPSRGKKQQRDTGTVQYTGTKSQPRTFLPVPVHVLYSTGYRYCPGAVLVLNCTGKKTPGEL